jgi:hypothetical protein
MCRLDTDLAHDRLAPAQAMLLRFLGGFGEGQAMLAAADGPEIRPHAADADSAADDSRPSRCSTEHLPTPKYVTADYSNRCSWPALSEPFATALRHAVDFTFQEFDPVGVIATGTIVRGKGHRSSDLDLQVVHLAPFRRRVQRWFDGVPTEIFVNPPAAIRAYFAEEDRDGRRVTAHMLATGVVVFQADPVVDDLRSEASQWLHKETPLSEYERVSTRYSIASRLEDALDLVGTDDVSATMLLGESVLAMLEYFCKAKHGQIPRRKDLLERVTTEHPDVAARVADFCQATRVSDRARLAIEIADQTIKVRGFFEWDSGIGPAPS